MSEHLATIRGSETALWDIIQRSTMAGRGSYENAYLNISDGELNIISSVSGSSASSYSTFVEGDWLTDISVTGVVQDHAGGEGRATVEALIDIDTFITYYELIKGGDGSVRLEFYGEPEDRLASIVEMYGGLNSRLHLPVSEAILGKMPLFIPDRFDEDDVWRSDKIDLDTTIHTSVDTVHRVIDAVEADDITKMDNFPIVVEDGVFKIDVTDDNGRNWISGSLDSAGQQVEGDDVSNLYGKGFKPIFQTLSGDVRLHTAPHDDGAPLVVIKETDEGIFRHIVAPTGAL